MTETSLTLKHTSWRAKWSCTSMLRSFQQTGRLASSFAFKRQKILASKAWPCQLWEQVIQLHHPQPLFLKLCVFTSILCQFWGMLKNVWELWVMRLGMSGPYWSILTYHRPFTVSTAATAVWFISIVNSLELHVVTG